MRLSVEELERDTFRGFFDEYLAQGVFDADGDDKTCAISKSVYRRLFDQESLPDKGTVFRAIHDEGTDVSSVTDKIGVSIRECQNAGLPVLREGFVKLWEYIYGCECEEKVDEWRTFQGYRPGQSLHLDEHVRFDRACRMLDQLKKDCEMLEKALNAAWPPDEA